MNTKPPIQPAVRDVWSSKEQAELDRLTARREKIMSERRAELREVFLDWTEHPEEHFLDWMIEHAVSVRRALSPFDDTPAN